MKIKEFLKRLISDVRTRVRVVLLGSVSLNLVYVISLIASGIFFRALWFYALAAYYIFLIIMRVFIFRETAKAIPGKDLLWEFRRYRFCGVLLLFMNIALGVLVFFVVYRNRVLQRSTLHTVVMSSYTVAATIWAVTNTIKYRKYESPLLSAAKAISLASATVSLLSLVSVFGYGEEGFGRWTAAAIGVAVLLFVLGMAVFMIVRANREIGKILIKND
ncbi:MAG: hypothetical protein E7412_07410 [Ruminococcaceae bacterium]|nr:hypothetical protein [Oscillospiraceae bacterium]